MRNEKEILDLLLKAAQEDDLIRAVQLAGSRANPAVQADRYRDYDVTYFVTDIKPFHNRPDWVIEKLGRPLIMQMPEAMRYPHGDGNFNYLIIFPDGVRIDLSFVFTKYIDNGEPVVTLLDKDNNSGFISGPPCRTDKIWHIKPPSQLFYYSCCNNFWWCLNNTAKGIARDELPYVMDMLETVIRQELNDMINWHIGIRHGFSLSAGKSGKYFKKYLDAGLYERYAKTYSSADYKNIRESIYVMAGLFHDLALTVADHFGFKYRQEEEDAMRLYIQMVWDEIR